MSEEIERIIGELRGQPGPLLVILHAIQDRLGCIPANSVPAIAEALHLSRAEVHGVISFYHHFRQTPPARHTVQVCRAEACLAMRGEALAAHVKARLRLDWHQVGADGQFGLEPVYCLGNCACAPALMIDQELHGRVTPEQFDALVRETPA